MPSAGDLAQFLVSLLPVPWGHCSQLSLVGHFLVLCFILWFLRYGTTSGLPPAPDCQSIPHGSNHESWTCVCGLACLPRKSHSAATLAWYAIRHASQRPIPEYLKDEDAKLCLPQSRCERALDVLYAVCLCQGLHPALHARRHVCK